MFASLLPGSTRRGTTYPLAILSKGQVLYIKWLIHMCLRPALAGRGGSSAAKPIYQVRWLTTAEPVRLFKTTVATRYSREDFFLNVEIYCDITTALCLWSRDGSAVVSLHPPAASMESSVRFL